MGQALVKQPLSKWEKSHGLLVHYRREGLPPEPPAPRCKVCGVNLIFNLGISITRRKHRRMPEYCKIHVPTKMPSMKRIIALLLLALSSVIITHGQGGNIGSNFTPTVNRQGIPIPGASISVCQPLTTTGASVNNNVATLTMLSNPQTVGFVQGMAIMVSGFNGADTYFNAGAIQGGQISGGAVILSVGSTTITYNLVHANATASTNGTVLQEGNTTTPCAGLSSIYVDPQLQTPRVNPFQSDQLGNWNAFVQPGIYFAQISAPFTTTIRQMVITGGGGVFSYPCVVSVPSTAWTCGHNLNVASIGWSCYNSTSLPASALFPDSVTETSNNVAIITWVNPTSGICQIFTTAPAATVVSAAVQTNPSSAQNIANGFPLNLNGPFTATSLTAPNVNAVVYAQVGSELGAQINVAMSNFPTVSIGGQSYPAGVVFIPCGTYSLTTQVTMASPAVFIAGYGSGCVNINSSAPTAFRVNTSPFTVAMAGKISGFTLNGNASNNQTGIHFGDIVGLHLYDVHIQGFTGTQAIGLWADNAADFTERTYIDKVHLDGNTTDLTFTEESGQASFGYTKVTNLYLNSSAGQVGISVGTGVLIYNSHLVANDNVNDTASPATVLQLVGTGQIIDTFFDLVAEQTTGSGGIFINSGASTVLRGAGILDGGTLTSTGTGSVTVCFTEFIGLVPNTVGCPAGYSTTANAFIVPQAGSAGNFLQGFGLNLWFNGVNWVANGDGINNGGQAVLGTEGSGSQLIGFYVIPSTGGSAQTVTPTQLANDLVGTIDNKGNHVVYGHLNQSATGKYAGTCTLGTNCSITFGSAFNSAPVCIGTDQTAANAVKANPSSSGVVFTGTGTDVIAWACFGNPN